MPRIRTLTGGRDATTAVIPGKGTLSIGHPGTACPPGYEWRALSEFARLESGHTPTRARSEYWDGSIPWLSIPDATNNHGRVIFDTAQHVSETGVANSSTRLLPPGTVCLSRTASVGYVIQMGVEMCTSQDFVNWVCGPDLNPAYLRYILMFEQESIRRFAHGTTHQTMYYPEAKALHAMMPSRLIQDSVAELLGALDDKIAVNARLNLTLDQLGSAIVAGSLGETSVPLGSIARITMGTSPEGESLNENAQGVPFYQGTRDFGFRFPSRRVHTTNPIRRAAVADILVSVRAPVGELNVAQEECCVGRGLAAVQSSIGTQSTLLHQLKLRPQVWAQFNASGTIFGSIKAGDLHDIPVMEVPGKEREMVESNVSSIERTIGGLLRESATLARVRNMILPKLMSGELRVRDAEKQVEEVV